MLAGDIVECVIELAMRLRMNREELLTGQDTSRSSLWTYFLTSNKKGCFEPSMTTPLSSINFAAHFGSTTPSRKRSPLTWGLTSMLQKSGDR